MEKRIELEKRGRPADQITDLILDNCRSTNIVGLTDEFTALQTLSLINVGLTTLKGFPKLPNLAKLELSDNRISNGLSNLTGSTKLTHLNLSGNKIKEVEELKALENLKSLQVLDLFNNEATAIQCYREKIFAMIPSLVYLDGFDANEVEALSEGESEDGAESEGDEDGNDEAFCINGMEIDLKELNNFEKQLKEKRKYNAVTVKQNLDEVDEIDEYLNKLALDIKAKECDSSKSRQTADVDEHDDGNRGCCSNNSCSSNDTRNLTVALPQKQPTCKQASADKNSSAQQNTPLPILLYWLLGIIFFVNTVSAKPNNNLSDDLGDDDDDDDDDGDEEEDDDDDEDNGDVSLAEVYNDDLEEDNSDYVEEGEDGEDDEEDVDSEEDDAAAPSANDKAPDQPAEEVSPARGKKRKHDG